MHRRIAAFWHIHWITGVLVVVSGSMGMTVYSIYTGKLYSDVDPETWKNL